MADREAKLRLILELVNAGKAAEATALIRQELQGAGAASAEATANLTETASAIDSVAEAESEASSQADNLARSMTEAGQAATDTGQETAAAASQSAQAVEGVTASVAEQSAATREAGEAAVDSGREVETAARAAGSAVDRLTQEWKDQIAAQRLAGTLTLDSAIASVDEYAAAVRKSGDDAETQLAALEGVANGLQADYEALERGAKDSGKTTTGEAKAIEQAMLRVREQIDQVRASMQTVGVAADAGAQESRIAFLSVEDALNLANDAAASAQQKLTDLGRLPKAEIGNLAQVIEGVTIAMERAAGTSRAATSEQIANAQALGAKLEELNAINARQLDAVDDNRVALKDQAGQMQALSSALSGLIGVTGNAGTAMSSFAQKGSGAFVAYDNAKNAIKAMDLNTLRLTTSTAAGKTQIGLAIAVMLASAAAGFKAASANKENADSVEHVTSGIKRLKDDALSGLADQWDGVQGAVQRATEVFLDIGQSVGTIVNSVESDTERITSNLDQFANTIYEAGIATLYGRDALNVYEGALRAGIPEQEAWNIAVMDSAAAAKFLAQAQQAGAEGNRIWVEGLEYAQGDVKKLEQYIREHNAEMHRAVTANKTLALAQAEQQKSAKELRATLDALDLVLGSEASSENALRLRLLGAELAKTAENAKLLTTAERERLNLAIEILERGDEMNAQQKVFAGLLINQARAGKEASEVLNTLARLVLDFDQATNGSTKSLDTLRSVLGQLGASYDENSQKIRRVIADMQSQLDATDGLSEAQRKAIQEQIDYLNASEAERDRIAALAAERTARYARDTVEQENRVRAAIRDRIEELRQIIPLSGSYGDDMAALAGELRDLMAATSGLTGAERERLETIAELASNGRDLTAAQREWVTALVAEVAAGQGASASANALVEARLKLATVTEGITFATNGTTAAINMHLDAITKSISANELQSVTLAKLAESLGAELAATDGLSAAQRAQIESLKELVARSDELTDAEKRRVVVVAEAIKAGREYTGTLGEAVVAEDARTARIRAQIEALREQIAIQERAQGLDKKQVDVNESWGASLDFLRMRERQLQEELEQGVYVVKSATAAKEEDSAVALERVKRLNEEAQAHDKVRASQDAIIQVVKDGRVEYTNLAAAQDASKQKGIEIIDTNGKVKKSADDAAETLRHLGTAFDVVTSNVDDARARLEQFVAVIDLANAKLKELDKQAQTVAGQ